jgi:integrase
MRTTQGYGNFTPPKESKRHPLTRQDTEKLYQAAVDFPDRETELVVRVMLDFGLRVGELIHCRAHWVDKEYQRATDSEIWRIKVPKVEDCYCGTGDVGKGNPSGANLHETKKACAECRHREWGGKTGDNGWVTERQAEKYDFAPKSERSATKVWQLPGLPESAETARLLKDFLKAHDHKQWPHTGNAVRNRLDHAIETADLDLPDRGRPKVVPHALRHTYGCRLVECGVGEGAGMKQMRHQSADVFRWYSDVRGTRVVNALADAVSEADSLLHK